MRFRPFFKMIGLGVMLGLMSLFSGCASMDIQDYKNETPALDLFQFFNGKTYAWGQFQDRSGKVIRRFVVNIDGVLSEPNKLTLTENFDYHDGEKQQRVWHITQTHSHHFIGTAADIIGEAVGESAGNALNWHYSLNLPYKDGTIHVKFDDWMFLHSPNIMMNQATVTKWGFKVGMVTLFFSKQPLEPFTQDVPNSSVVDKD